MGEIKQLNQSHFKEIFSLSQFAFQKELTKEELQKKEAEAERHTIWGWMVEGKLAGKLHLIPLSVYVNGKAFEMGGISSVATWPEYRRQGIAKELLQKALTHMKENGQMISYLHPFSVSFYRKYGWDITFSEKHYTVPIVNLKRKWNGEGYIRSIDAKENIALLHTLYTQYAKEYNGMLVRDEKWWEQRVLTDDRYHTAVAFDSEGNPKGYIIFRVKNNIFTVKEIVHTGLNSRKLLCEFIANHDSMADEVTLTVPENDNLPLLVDEPTFTQKISPYFMARIVDVYSFLKQYPFENNPELEGKIVCLTVHDRFLSENSRTYELRWNDGHVSMDVIQSKATTEGIHCNVEVLSALLLNYKRPAELLEVGLLKGNKEQIDILEVAIPDVQSHFADFF
ncbi:GNAT family N-acetyltransferase [Virgibacillus sp. W0430]|uniref:GNAT family N-acetyltransferase n=1 Tax=Virgibacillus sp. W0430 TaxID=3391580 RepID=UPI003F47FD70